MTARTCEWHDMPIPCKACDTSTVTNLIFGPAATRKQPEPVKTESVPVVHYVIKDMLARADVGLDRYGTMLKADNGRDHLVDAYQEALDVCWARWRTIAAPVRRLREERRALREALAEVLGPASPPPVSSDVVKNMLNQIEAFSTAMRRTWGEP